MNFSLEWHVLVLHTSQDRSLGVSSSAVRVNKIMFYFESFVIKSVKVAGKCIIYKDIQFPKLANISKVASVMKFLVSAEKGKALVNKDMHTARWMYYSQITNDKLYFCEAQGKGRAQGRPRKVTQRSFIDCRWWISFPWCFTLNLVANTFQ